MITKAKHVIYYSMYVSGLSAIFRRLFQSAYKLPVRILYTHQVVNNNHKYGSFLQKLGPFSVDEFEKRIIYLRKRYAFITLDEWATCLKENRKPAFPSMVLTFDDGYHNVYTDAFPLLKKYSIPATVFLTTDCIDSGKVLLHDQFIYMIGTGKVSGFNLPSISHKTYSLATESDRLITFAEINNRLKKIPNEDKAQIISQLGIIQNISNDEIRGATAMLSWKEVKEMHESGLISFEAHTVSHPILTRISMEQAKYEIQHPKSLIEKHLDKEVHFIAYPNGRSDDYNEPIKDLVRDSGYSFAFTTLEFTGQVYDPFEIPRYGFENEPFYLFSLRMSGFSDLVSSALGRV